ncbi:MAG TPA: hypothetical protein VG937_33305 [Polyangiaceae bacterium]|nr:hypothetical protein [Polyangiaceae bacterium]
MLERYKRTFYGTQAIIVAVTAVIWFQLRAFQTAAVFFVMMQFGAVVGALWASSLKRRIEQGQNRFLSR